MGKFGVNVKTNIDDLYRLNFDGFRKDFLLSWDKSMDDIKAVITMAEILREFHRDNVGLRVFRTGLAVSFFRDKSTRTRLAYASACDLLGLTIQEMDEEKSQIAHGETIRETANMISFLSEVIGIRDDMYLGRGHNFMKEVTHALDGGFAEGVLGRRPAVINLQCDLDHPTQTLSDLVHLKNYFGGLNELKNKKLVMSWAYSPSYGKPLSVPQGIISLLSRFGMDIVLAYPEKYDLVPEVVETSKKFAKESGGSFTITHDMKEAFKNADAVYPKSWAPYWVMQKRTDLMYNDDKKGLRELEKECLAQNAKHKNWLCDEELMKTTSKGNALYLHCLPADVQGLNCLEGEVTMKVFEKYRVETYKEARYKAFVIAAMIIICCFRDPVSIIDKLFRENLNRAG
jgi:knotted carbamoyltransferase YgeW